MTPEPGDIELVDPVKYLGTSNNTIQVILGPSPAYYTLMSDREDFDELLGTLVDAWRRETPVRVVIRGIEIVSVQPA